MYIYDNFSPNSSSNEKCFIHKITYLQKLWRLWDVEKHCRARKTTNDNMGHAFWMLDT